MKDSILIVADGDQSWIGGLYYRKNIVYSLSLNKKICDHYNILVLTNKKNENIFSNISKDVKVISYDTRNHKLAILYKLWICITKHVKYVFPVTNTHAFKKLGITPIAWIADFQHKHLPEFFSVDTIRQRVDRDEQIASDNIPVVLSSENAKNDFLHFYNVKSDKVVVVPFVSYIAEELKVSTSDTVESVLNKYGLRGKKYICICNQFWQHKNHLVVFHAIEKFFLDHRDYDLEFVFTGEMSDTRNSVYINELINLYNKDSIKSHCKILGFIDRHEQIALMKNAVCIIQPSLFEGWGTVVEDCKVLNKLIILSDIPVHREQMNSNCVLFNPYDFSSLVDAILSVLSMEHIDDDKKGLEEMRESAYKYSKKFERILEL